MKKRIDTKKKSEILKRFTHNANEKTPGTENFLAELVEFICDSSCEFYKGKQDEETRCYGFEYIQTLFKKKPHRLSNLKLAETDFSSLDKLLYDIICTSCLFLKDGCDFRNKDVEYPNGEKKVPCGSLLVLSYFPDLIENTSDKNNR